MDRKIRINISSCPVNVACSEEAEMGEQSAERPTVDKTPVSLLQEIFIREGKPPSYELIYSEGVGESAIFRYSVSVGDITAVGEGKSKRRGKHAAALVMLKKLGRWRDGGGCSEGGTEAEGSREGGREGGRASKATGEQEENPTGDVNELCHAHKVEISNIDSCRPPLFC